MGDGLTVAIKPKQSFINWLHHFSAVFGCVVQKMVLGIVLMAVLWFETVRVQYTLDQLCST